MSYFHLKRGKMLWDLVKWEINLLFGKKMSQNGCFLCLEKLSELEYYAWGRIVDEMIDIRTNRANTFESEI